MTTMLVLRAPCPNNNVVMVGIFQTQKPNRETPRTETHITCDVTQKQKITGIESS